MNIEVYYVDSPAERKVFKTNTSIEAAKLFVKFQPRDYESTVHCEYFNDDFEEIKESFRLSEISDKKNIGPAKPKKQELEHEKNINRKILRSKNQTETNYHNDEIIDKTSKIFISPSLVTYMRIIAISEIVIGTILSLTIIGAIVGVPNIIAGIKLKKSTNFIELFLHNGSISNLEKSFEQQASFYLINVILLMIGLAILGLVIIATTLHFL